jgi:hypothetical protein
MTDCHPTLFSTLTHTHTHILLWHLVFPEFKVRAYVLTDNTTVQLTKSKKKENNTSYAKRLHIAINSEITDKIQCLAKLLVTTWQNSILIHINCVSLTYCLLRHSVLQKKFPSPCPLPNDCLAPTDLRNVLLCVQPMWYFYSEQHFVLAMYEAPHLSHFGLRHSI